MNTPFKSDLINNMDQKRISGTKPSSVINLSEYLFKDLRSEKSDNLKIVASSD